MPLSGKAILLLRRCHSVRLWSYFEASCCPQYEPVPKESVLTVIGQPAGLGRDILAVSSEPKSEQSIETVPVENGQ